MMMAELVLAQTAAEQKRMAFSHKRQQTKYAATATAWRTVWSGNTVVVLWSGHCSAPLQTLNAGRNC